MNRYVKASLLITVGVIAYLAVAALYVQSVIPETHQRYDSDERVRAFNDAYGPGGTVAVTTTGSLWSVDSISYSETRGTKSAELVIHIDEHDRMELNCYDTVLANGPSRFTAWTPRQLTTSHHLSPPAASATRGAQSRPDHATATVQHFWAQAGPGGSPLRAPLATRKNTIRARRPRRPPPAALPDAGSSRKSQPGVNF